MGCFEKEKSEGKMYLILRGRRPGRVMHQLKTGINYTRILRFLIKLWTVVFFINRFEEFIRLEED